MSAMQEMMGPLMRKMQGAVEESLREIQGDKPRQE